MTGNTDFKMIPGQDELDQMERDLRFYPSTVQNPTTLTRTQIEHFNRDGFLKGIRVFDGDEILENRRYFDALLEQYLAEGKDSYSISTAHRKHGCVFDLLTNDGIVACVRDILGENIIGWGSHFFCKMPHDGKAVAWHQDGTLPIPIGLYRRRSRSRC